MKLFAIVRFVESTGEYKWQSYAVTDEGYPNVEPVAGGSFAMEDLEARGSPDTHDHDLISLVAELAEVHPRTVLVGPLL